MTPAETRRQKVTETVQMDSKTVLVYYSIIILLTTIQGNSGVSITFNPEKPAVGDSTTITCKRSDSSTDGISWDVDSSALTSCDGSTDNLCVPSSPGSYTTSTDVSEDIFSLSLASVTLSDCKTYTCTSTGDSTDAVSSDLQVYYYDQSETDFTESAGTLSVTTGCVLSTKEMQIDWKIVKDNVELPVEATKTVDATGCTDTCHSETSGKVTSSLTHTEYSGSDYEIVTYRAIIRYSTYTNEVRNSTATYRMKKTDGGSNEKCPEWCIITITCIICILFVIGIVVGFFIFCTENSWKKTYVGDKCPFKGKWLLLLVLLLFTVVGIGILTVFTVYCCYRIFKSSEQPQGNTITPAPPEKSSETSTTSGIPKNKVQDGHDGKGHSVSVNYHPLTISIPEKKAGALDPVHKKSGEQEKKKKKKKKKKRERETNEEHDADN